MPNIKYDGCVRISAAGSRRSLQWKNREMLWSELLERLASTSRTGETAAEYGRMSKEKQDQIKDVGGFVGGWLRSGRRRADTVLDRTLLTLDADYADETFWEAFTLLYDYAGCIYSTHKHAPQKPRLRFLVPLSRPVSPEEYVAVARRIAADLGIEQFDDTTYEPSRLMYWPSTSQDAPYLFEYQDGPWLEPDRILARYHDWTDTAEWPTSSRSAAVRKKLSEKQGDPLTKKGAVGAFCRAYSIQEAIEKFIPDVYTPCAIPGRYTYAKGSTSGGLIVYDDRFAYSHHATDPAGGKLVNAFDLVRLHLFGERDEDEGADTPVTKLPSYAAMISLTQQDDRTQERRIEEKQAELAAEFGPAAGDAGWMKQLERTADDKIAKTIENFYLIVKNDARLKDAVCLNEFSGRLVLRKDVPWRTVRDPVNGDAWTDADDSCLRNYVERSYRLHHAQKLNDAFNRASLESAFHPVRDYLRALVWDQSPRLDRLLTDYLGAEDTAYTRTVTAKSLIAAVARVMRPGCKFDEMLVLVGPQGIGKSTLFRLLGRGWYSDSLTSVSDGKNSYEQLQGVWIIEMGELNALRKKEAEEVKNFLSKCEDIFRAAYGRHTSVYPRQCIFVGTTNEAGFLQDSTGDRRFWPVDVGRQKPAKDIWKDLTCEEVDQIWAEAFARWRAGESFHLDAEERREAAAAQEAHKADNPKAAEIRAYLDRLLPADWESRDTGSRIGFFQGDFGKGEGVILRQTVCAMEIWRECLCGTAKDLGSGQAREIHNIMRTLTEWERHTEKRVFPGYGLQRVWYQRRSEPGKTDDGNDGTTER